MKFVLGHETIIYEESHRGVPTFIRRRKQILVHIPETKIRFAQHRLHDCFFNDGYLEDFQVSASDTLQRNLINLLFMKVFPDEKNYNAVRKLPVYVGDIPRNFLLHRRHDISERSHLPNLHTTNSVLPFHFGSLHDF